MLWIRFIIVIFVQVMSICTTRIVSYGIVARTRKVRNNMRVFSRINLNTSFAYVMQKLSDSSKENHTITWIKAKMLNHHSSKCRMWNRGRKKCDYYCAKFRVYFMVFVKSFGRNTRFRTRQRTTFTGRLLSLIRAVWLKFLLRKKNQRYDRTTASYHGC